MPVILTQSATISDDYGQSVTLGYLKCNELRVNPDNLSMTIQYWLSIDGVTWGGMKTLKLQDNIDTGITEMTTACNDITAHLVAENVQVSDSLYVVNKRACYYIVADRVFNTTYTII